MFAILYCIREGDMIVLTSERRGQHNVRSDECIDVDADGRKRGER